MDNLNIIPETNTASQDTQENIMKAFEVEQEQNISEGVNTEQPISQEDNYTENIAEIEIDDKFKTLPKEEALLRTYQSRYDKLYSQYQNTLREIEQVRQYKELVDNIMSDDELFEAFVYQRKPDLIKQKDITELIKEKMKEEFGDYRPTREEAEEEPGGKAWLYYKRLDELYDEFKKKTNNTKYKSIEEMLKARAKEREEQELRLKEEIEKVKSSLNWSDDQILKFRDWASKLSVLDLAKIYNFALRTMRVPTATNVGSSKKTASNAREEFLRSLKI